MGIKMKKRGVFFSIDALIAVGIIILVILIAYPVLKVTKKDANIHKDVLSSLSTIKIIEINDSYIQNLSRDGIINNTNKSILEQIGEFYITNITLAKYLANVTLKEIKTNKNTNKKNTFSLLILNKLTSLN
jgi:DNA replication protein DnaD